MIASVIVRFLDDLTLGNEWDYTFFKKLLKANCSHKK